MVRDRTPPQEKLAEASTFLLSGLPLLLGVFAEFRLIGIFDGFFTFFVKSLKSRSILIVAAEMKTRRELQCAECAR